MSLQEDIDHLSKIPLRCNRPAIRCTTNNGFRLCAKHFAEYDQSRTPEVEWIYSTGTCDLPIKDL